MTIQPPPTPLAVPLPASAAFSESAIRALPSDAYYASPSTGSDSGASKQTPPAWLNDLRTKGYAVVPDLVPQERCDAYVNDALTWLEDFGLGFKRDDKETWHGDKLPVHHVGGLYNRYACAHEDWIWRIRCEPNIIKTFAELWGTSELLVSFDAVNVTFPYGEHGRTDVDWVKPWPHQDQDPENPVFQLAQGIFTCSPAGPDDGGLCVMSGSHLLHQQFYAEHGGVDHARIKSLNSYHFKEEEAEWYKSKGCEEVKVVAPAGALILWDSRLMHWNRLPTGDRIRVAGYVCYQPRSHATPEQIERKKEVFEQRRVATHWPILNDVREDYQGPPQRDGKPDPANRTRPVHEPELTDTLLKLAGVKAY